MATITRPSHYDHPRSGILKACSFFGFFYLVIGVAGMITPGFLGMHLSIGHNIVHLASGALALWVGLSNDPKKAHTFCIAFGSVYGLLGILGFVLGQPGYPAVGHMASDRNLLRIIPNVLEFGTNDHVVHIFFSVVLLVTGMTWQRGINQATRSLVKVQGRTTRPTELNSKTDLKDADLGTSDVNRPSDLKRRSDFERRL